MMMILWQFYSNSLFRSHHTHSTWSSLVGEGMPPFVEKKSCRKILQKIQNHYNKGNLANNLSLLQSLLCHLLWKVTVSILLENPPIDIWQIDPHGQKKLDRDKKFLQTHQIKHFWKWCMSISTSGQENFNSFSRTGPRLQISGCWTPPW